MTAMQLEGLRFEETPGGLTRAVVSTPLCEGDIYLQGAHVTHWTPCGQKPVLFVSSKSAFAPGKAIRGGVPVIFPWFGPRSDGKPGPAHGFARTSLWTVESSALRGDGALEIGFVLETDEFRVRFAVAMGTALEMSLEVLNRGSAEARFEEALHTYLAVADVREASVTGLEGTTYIDKTDGFSRKPQGPEPLRLAKATDSVYLKTAAACTVTDPVWERKIVVEKSGSASTVVWNPWAGMADMDAEQWPGMICVETANASDNAVTLAGGAVHKMSAVIRLG